MESGKEWGVYSRRLEGRKEGYKDFMVNDLMNAHGWPIERLFEKITSAFTHINAVDGSF